MLIGITGYNGRIGQEMLKFVDTVPLACDVRVPSEVDLSVRSVKPDVILHLASITDVDRCEDITNRKLVNDTNVRGSFYVAEVAEKYNIPMVAVSTVHVFDGSGGLYYEKSRPNPLNYYGLMKMAVESFRDIFSSLRIVRTSYLFDYERLARHIYPLKCGYPFEYPVFIDRNFMFLPHFVESLHEYLLRIEQMPKMLHIAGTKSVSWFTFMKEAARVYGIDDSLVCPRDYEIKGVPRPYHVGLDVSLSSRLGIPQYSYVQGLHEMKDGS